MLPPGGSSNLVTSRFTRHMNIVGMDSFKESTLTKIFTAIMDWHFQKGFSESICRMSKVRKLEATRYITLCMLYLITLAQ